jgi:hypothetical protein
MQSLPYRHAGFSMLVQFAPSQGKKISSLCQWVLTKKSTGLSDTGAILGEVSTSLKAIDAAGY